MKTNTVFMALIMGAFALAAPLPADAQHRVHHSVFGNGGSIISGVGNTIGSTAGQPVIGVAGGPSHINSIGFWYLSGGFFTEVGQTAGTVPKTYWLGQNYPNPFNPSTTIVYHLPENAAVQLKIFDTLGKEVKRLVDEDNTIGLHRIHLDLQDFASGIYFYQLRTNAFTQTKRLMLVK
jgi:hypothetical protein